MAYFCITRCLGRRQRFFPLPLLPPMGGGATWAQALCASQALRPPPRALMHWRLGLPLVGLR